MESSRDKGARQQITSFQTRKLLYTQTRLIKGEHENRDISLSELQHNQIISNR